MHTQHLSALLLLTLGLCAFMASRPSRKHTMSKQVITIETTKGVIECTLLTAIAPKACENIIKLAQKGYYDGTIFHRIIPGFMIQGGDPTGTGRGGNSIWGAPFADETSPAVTFNRPGLLAMANAGPHTNGSQFFITTAATPWLNGAHTIFGEVTAGYEVVKALEASGSSSGRPKTTEKIIKIELQ